MTKEENPGLSQALDSVLMARAAVGIDSSSEGGRAAFTTAIMGVYGESFAAATSLDEVGRLFGAAIASHISLTLDVLGLLTRVTGRPPDDLLREATGRS